MTEQEKQPTLEEQTVPTQMGLRWHIFKFFLSALLPILVLLMLATELILLPQIKRHAYSELKNATRLICHSIESSTTIAIRNHLRAIAKQNRQIAKGYLARAENNDNLSREEAIKEIEKLFLSQQVGTSGYLYCLDSEGNIPIHPKDEIEGSNQSEFKFVRDQMSRKNGYLEYGWKNPGETKKRQKALFMTYLEELDWIISASSYRSEFNELVRARDLREAILSLKFGDSGYAYVFDENGNVLIHPTLKDFNILQQNDFPVDFVRTMIQEKSGIIEHEWQPEGSDKTRRKVVIYDTVEAFGWTVCSSAYLNEINKPVITARMFAYLGVLLLIITAAVTAYRLSGRFTTPVSRMIDRLDQNTQTGSEVPLPYCSITELNRLAREFNDQFTYLAKQRDELNASAKRFETLFELNPFPCSINAPDGLYLMVNRSYCQAVGLPAQEILQHTPQELADHIPEHQFEAIRKKALDKGSISGQELTISTDHTTRHILCWSQLIDLDDGNAILTATIDITERKRAEERLRSSEEHLRITLNSIGDAVIVTDLDSRITRINPVAENLTEWHGQAPLGKALSEVFNIINANTRKAAPNPAERVIATGNVVGLANHTVLIDRKGKEHHISDSGAPIRDNNGEIRGAVLVFRDVSEEYAMQERLHHAQKMEAVGQLAGGIAHDFNNMLGGIVGATEILDVKLGGTSEQKKYIRMILNSAERAATLTDKLLAFGRKQPEASAIIDIKNPIEDAILLLENTADRRISVTKALPETPCLVKGDSSQLQNAFLNLLINASHAMPEGGRITVSCQTQHLNKQDTTKMSFDISPGQFFTIEIKDTGCGIEREHLNQIFEPFFTTKGRGKGTGLGLAAVLGTIQQHRGGVSVDSVVGKGTSFRIFLPVSEEAPASSSVINDQADPVPGHGNILVIDDETTMRETAKALLEDLGYTVLEACNGKEGIDVFQANMATIDLVVLDMIMPEMNGHDCLLKLRSLSPSIPVIVASGFAEEMELSAIRDCGIQGFLRKPFRNATLSREVKRVLQR